MESVLQELRVNLNLLFWIMEYWIFMLSMGEFDFLFILVSEWCREVIFFGYHVECWLGEVESQKGDYLIFSWNDDLTKLSVEKLRLDEDFESSLIVQFLCLLLFSFSFLQFLIETESCFILCCFKMWSIISEILLYCLRYYC